MILPAALLFLASPAVAAVTVIGGSSARVCYEAADSPLGPTAGELAACDHALTAEQLVPSDVVATRVNRGILRVRAGRLDDGIADFDAAIALDPSVGEAHFNRGVAFLRRNRAAEALPSFAIAVEGASMRPALAHFGRAAAYEALGDLRAAYADYRRASEIEPDWDRPRAALARFTVRNN
jgi:tetratricopeptide (TPR) repeat protein